MKIFKIILINLIASMVVGLIAVELLFGQWLKAGIPMGGLNILAGKTFHHNVEGLYSPVKKIIRYERDRHGFRGRYDSVGSIEILTMGGSTTEQRYINEGETWQDRLSQNFLKDGKKVDVVNAGVDGHSSVGHLRSFDLWLSRIPGLKVSYVLIYIGINDIYTLGENEFDRKLASGADQGSVLDRSAIVYLFRTFSGWIAAARSHDLAHRRVDFKRIPWTHQPIQKHPENFLLPYEKDYRSRLRAINREVRRMGAKPIFVTQTRAVIRNDKGLVYGNQSVRRLGSYALNGVDDYRLILGINRLTMEECAGMGAICIDLGAEIDLNLDDYYDYYHLNPSGAEKVASYLHKKLRTWI